MIRSKRVIRYGELDVSGYRKNRQSGNNREEEGDAKKKKQWWRRTRCEYVSCYITHIRRHKNTQGQQRGEHTKKAFLWFKKEKKSTKGELIIKKSTAMCVWRKSDNKLCMIQHRQERGSVKQTLGDMKVLLGWGRMYMSFYFSHQNFKPCGLQAL